ncbi:MAG: hypothetical protein P1P88_01810 [Bacteroidales bacterium]|nr:hypothetical protein [Bacteroidales bacterium]
MATILFACSKNKLPLYQSELYSITDSAVVQANYTARALSSTEITSNYQSPASDKISALMEFKFSINGKDNEKLFAMNHKYLFNTGEDANNTISLAFGSDDLMQDIDAGGKALPPNTKLTVKLDFTKVLQDFEEKGFFEAVTGEKIYKSDFKGLYMAGNTAPLSWDFENLHNKGLELKDSDGDGVFELELVMNPYNPDNFTQNHWKLGNDISKYPQLTSGKVIIDALYNLGLDETVMNIENDGTFRTGKEWPGVWTRDVSYSVFLSLGIIEPEICKTSLLRKVSNGRIIQDTGTGGAWPVSSDRTTWVIAAYELYKITGDEEWLNIIYPIIEKSLQADLKTIVDPVTGLMRGESSFLDWRKQTFPKWMNSTDIYESMCLGTNAVHFRAYEIMAEMAIIKGKDATIYNKVAQKLKTAINQHLWVEDKGYYGQFIYGRASKVLSPKSESLGEALSVLFRIPTPEQSKKVISNTPMVSFGAPCVYPQIPQIPPYHNNAVWPFVQAFWNIAAAKNLNYSALEQGLAAFYRPAAMFLTNKENFVADNGDFKGTEINSDRQLWSVAANMSMIYRVLLGMNFEKDGILLTPTVPEAYGNKIVLNNFKYRKAILDFELLGFGNEISQISLDGEKLEKSFIPGNLEGKHTIKIQLNSSIKDKGKFNLVENTFSPAMPYVSEKERTLSWEPIDGIKEYIIYKNGQESKRTNSLEYNPVNSYITDEWQVASSATNGVNSFLSEPINPVNENSAYFIDAAYFAKASTLPYQGFTGKGFIELSKEKNRKVSMSFEAEADGKYLIDFRYSNGSGPYNTDNKCAIRTLSINNETIGVIVMPQIGKDEWSNFGYSNLWEVALKKGKNVIELSFEDYNENMNVEVNRAMLDGVRIRKMGLTTE